jgi:DNA-directed RNA polymerase subunit RPC12/RpoP
MTTAEHVDANALAGALMELFGREMTDARTCCAACGAVNRLGALLVYERAAGNVVRCPSCGSVELVAVERPSGLRFYFVALRWVDAVQAPATRAR